MVATQVTRLETRAQLKRAHTTQVGGLAPHRSNRLDDRGRELECQLVDLQAGIRAGLETVDPLASCRQEAAFVAGHQQEMAPQAGHRQEVARRAGHRQEVALRAGRRQEAAHRVGRRQEVDPQAARRDGRHQEVDPRAGRKEAPQAAP